VGDNGSHPSDSPSSLTNQPAESPSKAKQQSQTTTTTTVKLTTTAREKNEGSSIDSIMHMEALNTIGLSQKELQERRQLDKKQKHKLGIPPSEYFERNRDDNASNLMKVHTPGGREGGRVEVDLTLLQIVAEGKEKRKNMVRSQVNFRKIQVSPLAPLPLTTLLPSLPCPLLSQQRNDEMAFLEATKSKLLQTALHPHRKYDLHLEESLSSKSSVPSASLNYEESLSDFKHMAHMEPLRNIEQPGKTFDATKKLITEALVRNEESLHEFLYKDQLSHSHLSSMSTLTPRDGDMHFRKIHNRMEQVASPPPSPFSSSSLRSRRIWRHSTS
jgi:hypothetical protein